MIKRSAITLMFCIALVFGMGTAAGAADAVCGNSPQTCDTTNGVPAEIPAAVSPSAPEVAAPTATPAAPTITPVAKQTLPVTGTETAALAFGGLVLVAAGGALVWRSNKAAA